MAVANLDGVVHVVWSIHIHGGGHITSCGTGDGAANSSRYIYSIICVSRQVGSDVGVACLSANITSSSCPLVRERANTTCRGDRQGGVGIVTNSGIGQGQSTNRGCININRFIGSLRDGASVISVGHHAGVGGVAAQRRGGVACIVGAHVGGTLLPLIGERSITRSACRHGCSRTRTNVIRRGRDGNIRQGGGVDRYRYIFNGGS